MNKTDVPAGGRNRRAAGEEQEVIDKLIVNLTPAPDKPPRPRNGKVCPNGAKRALDPVCLVRMEALEELLSRFGVLRLDFMGLRELKLHGWTQATVEKTASDLVASGAATVENAGGVVVIRLVTDKEGNAA